MSEAVEETRGSAGGSEGGRGLQRATLGMALGTAVSRLTGVGQMMEPERVREHEDPADPGEA